MSNGRVTAMRWTMLLGSLFGVTGWALFGASTARTGPEAVAHKHEPAWADSSEPGDASRGRDLAPPRESGPGASPFSSTMKRTEAPPQGTVQPAGYPIAGGAPPAAGLPPVSGAGRSYWPQDPPDRVAAAGARPPVPTQSPPFAPTDYPATAAAAPGRSGYAANPGAADYPAANPAAGAAPGDFGYAANSADSRYAPGGSRYPTAIEGAGAVRPGAMPIPSVPPGGGATAAAWTEPTSGPAGDAGVRPVGAVAAAPDDDAWRDSDELKHLQLELRAAGAVFYRLERWGRPAQYRFVCRASAADASGAVAEAEFESVADRPLAAIRQVLAQLLARRAGA